MSQRYIRAGLLLAAILFAGCGSTSPPPPTPEEAAKTPSHPAPKGANSARDESLPK